MENRKPYVLTIAIVIAIGMFFAPPVGAYEVNTHAYLTSEAVELYNKSVSDNKITPELKRFMIDGAMHEDDLPRPQNHFYDPINNKGLGGGFFSGISSKNWVNNSKEQGKIEYKLGATTSLAPVDEKKIDAYSKTTDFTWDRGIRYWLNGDKEMAMEVLGHVLHLVEDMGVPEHTRNDSHAGGSAYEKYAGRHEANNPDGELRTRLGEKKMYTLDSLGDYFDGLARYSNKYFYSPGSLGVYDFPELNYMNAESKEGKYYIANKDDEGVKYYLAIKKNIANVALGYVDVSVDREPIVESYWSLLSVRTVRYSAGVIELFFKDVEKAKNDPSFLKGEQSSVGILGKVSAFAGSFFGGAKDVVVKAGSFLGGMFNAVGDGLSSARSFVGGLFTGNDGLTAIGVVGVDDSEGLNTGSDSSSGGTAAPTAAAVKKDVLAKKNDEITALKMQIDGLQKDAKAQDAALAKLEKKKDETEEIPASAGMTKEVKMTNKGVKSGAKMASAPLCVYDSTVHASQGGLIINEVAWMGGVRSASDEWIELKNVSGSDIDVSEWQLVNKAGGVKIRLSDLKNPIIKAGMFILLERTDNNSAVGATADLIYSGALGNTNDGLKLFDVSCGVVDEILVASKWIAGNNDTKQTMERDAYGRGWHTSSSAGGTPKKENSAGVVQLNGGGSSYSGVGGDSITRLTYPMLLINKVQTASASSTHDEFVELYNPNDVAVDLTGWYVQKKTKTAADFSTFAKADLFTGKRIDAHGTVTIAHPSSTVAYAVASVYGIANDNTLVIKNPNGDISDKVGWGEAGDCEGVCAVSPADGQAILRKVVDGVVVDTDDNVNDFVLSALQILDSGFRQEADGLQAGMTDTKDDNVAEQDDEVADVFTFDVTSTLLWSVSSLSGHVYDFPMDGWLGQRVSFDKEVAIGSIQLGYFNMFVPGSVEVAIFNAQGEQQLATTIVAPQMPYGGYLTHELSGPLRLVAGDYFIGTRLISGAIGIRRGIGVNPCGVAVHKTGIIPACNNGDDVGMKVWSYATSTPVDLIVTEGILDQVGPPAGGDNAVATSTNVIDADVVINEIMYDLPGTDADREWIEIHNVGTTTVDIADWKFFENDTRHNLAIVQGASVLPAGGYAVIVASSSAFLSDHAGYVGIIFDSAFSLSNTGETLALKNGDLVIDTVTYTATTSADGTGMSLQRFDDGWHAASSTPGVENKVLTIIENLIVAPIDVAPIGQPIHSAKSNAYQASYYVQTLGNGFINEIKNVQIYVESDQIASWEVGVCIIPGGIVSRCLQSAISSSLIKQPSDGINAKTLRRFDFKVPTLLNPAIDYALYVNPIGPPNLVSSVYGASSDAYSNGALYGFGGGGTMFGVGIRDMYFVVNSADDIEPVVPDPEPEDVATSTPEITFPSPEQDNATTTPDVVPDGIDPNATSTEGVFEE